MPIPTPRPSRFLPWRGEIDPTARMFCDISTPDGQPSVSDPRNVLKRSLAKAADRGFSFYTHPEIEFYLLKSSKLEGGRPVPVDSAGFFDNVPGGTAHDFRRRSVRMLEDLGISVEFSHHEAGPGQNEIDLRYADALTTADNIMTFRTVIKEVAIEQGVYATFMPKPMSDQPGSGMHTHMSLFEGDTNAFYDGGGHYQLSKIGRQFVAGLLKHAPEMTAVTNQFVNSYKRLWGGDEAPSYVTWGHNNRSALVRVPLYKPNKGQSARVEYRAIDSAANPYLTFSLLLAAGLKGIEEGYELPPEAEDNVWELSESERRALGYKPAAGEPRPRGVAHGRVRTRRRDPRRAGVQLRAAEQAPRVEPVPCAGDPVRAGEQPRDSVARPDVPHRNRPHRTREARLRRPRTRVVERLVELGEPQLVPLFARAADPDQALRAARAASRQLAEGTEGTLADDGCRGAASSACSAHPRASVTSSRAIPRVWPTCPSRSTAPLATSGPTSWTPSTALAVTLRGWRCGCGTAATSFG